MNELHYSLSNSPQRLLTRGKHEGKTALEIAERAEVAARLRE